MAGERQFHALYPIVVHRGTPSPSTPPAVAQGKTLHLLPVLGHCSPRHHPFQAPLQHGRSRCEPTGGPQEDRGRQGGGEGMVVGEQSHGARGSWRALPYRITRYAHREHELPSPPPPPPPRPPFLPRHYALYSMGHSRTISVSRYLQVPCT